MSPTLAEKIDHPTSSPSQTRQTIRPTTTSSLLTRSKTQTNGKRPTEASKATSSVSSISRIPLIRSLLKSTIQKRVYRATKATRSDSTLITIVQRKKSKEVTIDTRSETTRRQFRPYECLWTLTLVPIIMMMTCRVIIRIGPTTVDVVCLRRSFYKTWPNCPKESRISEDIWIMRLIMFRFMCHCSPIARNGPLAKWFPSWETMARLFAFSAAPIPFWTMSSLHPQTWRKFELLGFFHQFDF
jgi:hypothetical protein